MESTSFNRLDYSYKLLVIIALSITGVVLAKDIVIPMAFAAFLSIVMLPLIKRMESRRINTVLATLLVLLGFTIVIVLLGWLIVDQLVALVNDLPDLQSRMEVFVNGLSKTLKNDFGISLSEQNSFIKETAKSVSSYLGDVLVSTSNLLSLIIQIPISLVSIKNI
jgi:putative heme transporter